MQRIPEPELMDDESQAAAYAEGDFGEPNQAFVERFVAAFPEVVDGTLVDLGCGPGDIVVRLCAALPQVHVVAVDGSRPMLELAERAVRAAGVSSRVEMRHALIHEVAAPRGGYRGVLSNSLLHHLPEPTVLWRAVHELGEPGAAVLVADLLRPRSEAAVSELVAAYASNDPPVLRRDFANSLRAAFTLDEVRGQLDEAGLRHFELEQVSDRHLAVWGKL